MRARLSAVRSQLRWLAPGIGIKRWVGLLLLGVVLIGLGLAYLIIDLYGPAPMPFLPRALTLQFLPRLWRPAVLGAAGLVAMLVAVGKINRVLLEPFLRPGQNVVDVVSEHRRRGRGPKIVAIGGGTGLATLLSGLKHQTSNLTAIVTVADDGGSSGRLRRALGVLPPGDFRNCIAALADDESLTTQLFHYRFGSEEHDLGGHSFGNLFITAMAEITGSFEGALLESSHVLNIRGQVVPSTLSDVKLVGELVDEAENVKRVEGESQIPLAPGAIRRVYLEPEDAPAYPGAIRAILEADLIVLGPGSLYTSLLPNLLVHDLTEAMRASRALRVYVCNTATQPGETEGYSMLDHVAAIERHTGPGLFPVILANARQHGQLLDRLRWVRLDPPVNGLRRVVTADLIDEARPWRHDSHKLATALMHLLAESQANLPVAEKSTAQDLKESFQ
jgi:uncharacterized cofD-like protein